MRKIYHYRYLKSGSLVSRNRNNCIQNGGFTISIIESDSRFAIGVAKCNRTDKYIKHLGRSMATARAEEIVEKSDDRYVAAALPLVTIPKTIERQLLFIAKKLNREVMSFVEF